MRKKILIIIFLIFFSLNGYCAPKTISLPEPHLKGNISVEEAMFLRRSIRNFVDKPLSLQELSQLLWSASGITNESGFRTAPSAGATFPLNTYVVIGNVEGIDDGIYFYYPNVNGLALKQSGDKRKDIADSCLFQKFISKAGISIVITVTYSRVLEHYPDKGKIFAHMEAGHAGQNIYLQAVSLDLGTVAIGAFRDNEIKNIMDLPEGEEPLYIFPVGRMR